MSGRRIFQDISDEEFEALFLEHGAAELGRRFKCSARSIQLHRQRVEKRLGYKIIKGEYQLMLQSTGFEAKEVINLEVRNGVVLVGSDAHYWPGMISTAHKGFLWACKELKPKVVIMNGDVLDGAQISRWPPPGWEYQPELVDELEACFDRLKEIKKASKGAKRIWTYGNHDQRFEHKIATLTREYKGVKGFHLHDHFDDWERCWLTFINHEEGKLGGVCVKHRFKGGHYAPRLNALMSGMHMVTGHLHSAKIMPHTDYHGTRWGVDCGTLAEPRGRQFTNYTEANPTDWRSGFAVLTFRDYRLMMPELCLVVDQGVLEFRGDYIKV